MEITKELVKDFIDNIPLIIIENPHCQGKIDVVGVRWGFGKVANENYGRKTTLKILDYLENPKNWKMLAKM